MPRSLLNPDQASKPPLICLSFLPPCNNSQLVNEPVVSSVIVDPSMSTHRSSSLCNSNMTLMQSVYNDVQQVSSISLLPTYHLSTAKVLDP
ncbi:Elongation factor 4 [Clarias magur]|uniref:Elongation factor 4 n=1 Tax=Clarias magur TaxID=1594786 RepID=A0A8J4TWQ3_CLAMG|nr:Elongation factor 4 [Clarias magur]